MWRLMCCVLIACFVQNVHGQRRLCGSDALDERKTLNCTEQIIGGGLFENNICKMDLFPANSENCTSMAFGPLVPNTYIGGVTLKPYVMRVEHNNNWIPFHKDHTALNITFSNIKWKTMSFRFRDKIKEIRNLCSHINISNDAMIDDRSVLYYDCYWSQTEDREGRSYILDFKAVGDGVVNRGQYYFNVPSAKMLSAVEEENWKPFVYIEIFPNKMRLHINPPPAPLKITAYRISVLKACDNASGCEVTSQTISLKNRTDDVTYDFGFVGENGLYSFNVTPIHRECERDMNRCSVVGSPKIKISSESQTMNICIASVTALVVATLFAYYVALRLIRRYWCQDYKRAEPNEIPEPTKVLVIYSPTNRLHAECVVSFVTYLRTEYGLDVLYDGDITDTKHLDPYTWAGEAFKVASHVMYIVGPAEETQYSIYDKPIITAHKDVDTLLLSFIKANRVSRNPKEVFNVFFEHSNGQVPMETKHDRVFFLLKDWQKLISFLSKNLLPKQQILRTEKGRCFLDDLTRAKKILSNQMKSDDVVIRCEKLPSDRKILL